MSDLQQRIERSAQFQRAMASFQNQAIILTSGIEGLKERYVRGEIPLARFEYWVGVILQHEQRAKLS